MNYEKQKCLESVWIGPWRERSPVAVTAPYLCILPHPPIFIPLSSPLPWQMFFYNIWSS